MWSLPGVPTQRGLVGLQRGTPRAGDGNMSAPAILLPGADHLEHVVAAMADAPRVVVCGGPRCGKTAVAVRASERYGRPVLFGDSLIGSLPWGEDSAEVSRWFELDCEWIIEGVVCVRALRKWRARHPGETPPFRVVRLTAGVHDLSDAQSAMAKGEASVWDEIEPALSGCMLRVMP